MRKLVLTVAGVARGESSQAAIGVILSDTQGRILERWGSPIGRATEEVAEYKALLEGLRRALPHQPGEIVVFLESRTVTNQILGHVSPREPSIQNLNRQVQEILRKFPRWRVSFVDPEVCRPARRLAEQALFEETRVERERAILRQEILSLVDALPVEELRRALSLLQSLQAAKG
jgi:ribonuclease HI